MPACSEWERWRVRACGDYGDTYDKRCHTYHDDKGRTRVARRGDCENFDSGCCDIRSATIYNNSRQQQPDAAELLQATLLEIERQRPKPKAPRLKAATPEACGEFIRQWGEFSEAGTAVAAGISVRSCIPDQLLATVCLLSDFPIHHVPSIRDDELLECLRYVVQPRRCISAIAMYDRLQLAAKSVASPHNANEVHRHVLSTWEAMNAAITDASCWPIFKNAGNMWGAWKPAAGKSFSKVFIEALRPHQFRESVRNELIIDDTPMENPESFCRRVLHLADQWPEMQRLVDAAVRGNYRYGRGGRDRVIEDAWNRRGDEVQSQCYQSGGYSTSFERWNYSCSGGESYNETPEYGGAQDNFNGWQSPRFKYSQPEPQCLSQNRDARPVRSRFFAGRKLHDRDSTIFSGDTGVGGTRVHTPEIFPGCDPGVRSDCGSRYHGMGAVPSRRAVSPVMRVRAMSMEPDTLVSHTACDTPKKGLDIAAPALPTLSAEIFTTSAVSETKLVQETAVVPELVEGKLENVVVEGTMMVEGTERVKCHGAEADLSTSSERMPSLVDGKGKEPTPNAVEGAERPAYYIVEDDFVSPSEVVPEIVEGKLETGKEIAPTAYGLALDHCEELELVVADEVVDERGKSLSTTMGMKSSCHERGLDFGLVFGWVSCVAVAAACAIGATTTAVLLEINPSRNVWIAAAKGHRFPVTG